jgi:hypothetical protein
MFNALLLCPASTHKWPPCPAAGLIPSDNYYYALTQSCPATALLMMGPQQALVFADMATEVSVLSVLGLGLS